eukprot:scaffold25924_cov66-Phaeocystis_antarctica.AAC.5
MFIAHLEQLRLAQLLAAPHAHLAAQCCGSLVISPQLLQQRLRRLPQLVANATQGHGDARIEHVAQLGEDDARLVTAQLRQRHRGAAGARGGVITLVSLQRSLRFCAECNVYGGGSCPRLSRCVPLAVYMHTTRNVQLEKAT